MKRMTAWALALLLLLTASPGGLCVLAEEQAADEYFDQLFRRADIVSGAALVSQRGSRVFERYFGAEDRKTKTPVTEDTVYKIASVSKMISAMGVMRLFDLGPWSPHELN